MASLLGKRSVAPMATCPKLINSSGKSEYGRFISRPVQLLFKDPFTKFRKLIKQQKSGIRGTV